MRNEFVPFQNELFPDSYTKLSFSLGAIHIRCLLKISDFWPPLSPLLFFIISMGFMHYFVFLGTLLHTTLRRRRLWTTPKVYHDHSVWVCLYVLGFLFFYKSRKKSILIFSQMQARWNSFKIRDKDSNFAQLIESSRFYSYYHKKEIHLIQSMIRKNFIWWTFFEK